MSQSENFSNKLHGIRYCSRCCYPETMDEIAFDEFGVCTACRSSEEKMQINWGERTKILEEILLKAKSSAGDNYDCVLPISGGKDSFYQAHVLCKVYGLKPLAVTFSHNWYSETGFYNLQRCLQVFELDHLQFTPSRSLVNKVARKSLGAIGDSCWHCHAGIGSFPLQIAVKFKIPLLIWGESVAENDGRASYKNPQQSFDRDYFTRISAKLTADEMVDETLSGRDLFPFQLPGYEEIEQTGVWGLHLGDYIFWDEERQTEWIRDVYGWRETEIEGAYKGYKSAECIMPGMHDFTCYLKRGFGRSTWQASVDVRAGLITKEEGHDLIKEFDPVRPEALDYYLSITGLTEETFLKEISDKKLKKLEGVDIPIKAKVTKNKERIQPFVEQIIEKHLNKADPRDTNE